MDLATIERNLAVVRRLCEGWAHLDLDAFREIFDPQVDYRNIPIEGDHHVGPEAAHKILSRFSERWEVRLEVHNIVADERVAMAERTEYFEHRAGTKEPFALPVMGTFELRDGKITAWRDYFDLTHLRLR